MRKSYQYASVIAAISLFGLGGAALLLHDKHSQGTVSDDVYWKKVAQVEERAAHNSDDAQVDDLVKLADRLNANSNLMPTNSTRIADMSRVKKEEPKKTMKLFDALNDDKDKDKEKEKSQETQPTPAQVMTPTIPAQSNEEIRQDVQENPKVDDQTTPQEEPTTQEGWNEEHTMYFRDGIYVTGEQEIDGDHYFFRDNGEVYDGWRDKEDENGNNVRLYYTKGKRASGRTEIGEDTYFFNKETGIMETNYWYTPSANEKYFYGDNGKELRGTTANIDGELYSFDESGKLQTGLHTEKYKGIEIQTYSDGSGKKIFGQTVTVGDKQYKLDAFTGGVYDGEWEGNKYKDKDGNYVSGKQVIAGRTLMFDENNELVHFWFKDKDGNHYFADPNSGELVTGLVTIDGKKYYFDKSSHQATKEGWQEAGALGMGKDGKVYFVPDGENAPYLATGKTKIGNDEYMFDEETGLLLTNQNGDYLTDENGKVTTGEQTVDGKERFYDPKTGKRIVGWYTDSNNKTYYYSADDGKVKGERIIDGVTFQFDNDSGELLSRGLVGDFFINDDGSIHKGLKTIDGKTYYFKPENQGKMAKGFTSIPGKYNNGKAISAYFGEDGVMKTGVLDIEGQEYYADPEKGIIRDDIVERDGKKYYYRANGVLFKGGKIKSGKKTITSDASGVVTNISEGLENPLLPANGSVETHPMGAPKQPGNPFQPGWCTTWAYDRFYEVYGYDPGIRGNGEANVRELVSAHPDKFQMSDTPVAGSLFSVPSGVISNGDAAIAGHVGFVEKVDGDTIYVSEGAYGSRGTVGYVKYNLSSFYGGKAKFAVPTDSDF